MRSTQHSTYTCTLRQLLACWPDSQLCVCWCAQSWPPRRFLFACGTVCSSLLVQLPRHVFSCTLVLQASLQSLHYSLRSPLTQCVNPFTPHTNTHVCVHNQRKKLLCRCCCQGWSDANMLRVSACVVLSNVLYIAPIAHTDARACRPKRQRHQPVCARLATSILNTAYNTDPVAALR